MNENTDKKITIQDRVQSLSLLLPMTENRSKIDV